MSSFKDEYAIVGAAQTEVGHLPERSKREIITEAARLAIEDAGVPREEIKATIRGYGNSAREIFPEYSDEFCRILGLPVNVHSRVGRGADKAALAILEGTQMINLGVTDYVLVAVAYTRWSETHVEDRAKTAKSATKMGLLGDEYGYAAPNQHVMLASRHMHEYGTTSEDLGRIAVAQREWACLNPDAYMHGRPITLEDHQNSQLIAEPYRLFDCCLVSDAGAAFLITSADNVKDTDPEPVYIKGLGFGEQVGHDWWEKLNYTRLAVESAKETAFKTAGITIDDVDVAQLYDCFTGEVVVQLEDYGWAEKGEAKELLRDERLGPDGDIPVNTGGGLLSSHHLADMTGFIECVRQLRGEGGKRQVPDAEIGLATGHGGEIVSPGMAAHHSTVVLGR